MLSSRSFIVSGLMFRSLSHFQFIFVYGVRQCSTFILLLAAFQFYQHRLLKRLCSTVCSALLCCRLVAHRYLGLHLGFLSCSISGFVSVPYYFEDYSFVVLSKVRDLDSTPISDRNSPQGGYRGNLPQNNNDYIIIYYIYIILYIYI